MNYSEQYLNALTLLVEKVQKALKTFKNGGLILVGDDGHRENEADLVFHACGATPENVNFAITHAKGLLCVSLSHEVANKLGFSSAPQLPGGMSHTNFTISVDASHDITSGISANDRAYTISLMANSKSTHLDFLSPGHIFPLRAMNGGLLARAGHTEALYELCQFAKLPCVAAMCEVLDEKGSAINPKLFQIENHKYNVFKELPYISTVEILWTKVLFQPANLTQFILNPEFIPPLEKEKPVTVFQFQQNLEKEITLPTTICIYNQNIKPENIHFSLTNGANHWHNNVPLKTCDVAIFMFGSGNCLEKIPFDFSSYCDMSAKEGLSRTKPAIKRAISTLRTLQFLALNYNYNLNMMVESTDFIIPEDKYFLDLVTKAHFNVH